MINIIIENLKYKIIPLGILLSTALCFSINSEAKEVTVRNDEELNKAVESVSEDTKIILDKAFVSEYHMLYISHEQPFNLVVDFNEVILEEEFDFNVTSDGELTVENLLIDGNKINEEENPPFLHLSSSNPKGKITLKNSTIKNVKIEDDTVVSAGGESEGLIEINNVLFENNSTEYGAGFAIQTEGNDVSVKNSTFLNNKSTTGGAAIDSSSGFKILEIENTKFINNTSSADGKYLRAGAGAIYAAYPFSNSRLIIKESLFQNNKVIKQSDEIYPSGGAISILNQREENEILIEGTTFVGNEGVGAGATLFESLTESNAKMKIENNTFYQNINKGLITKVKTTRENAPSVDGGAISMRYSESEEPNTDNNINTVNNTFIENSVIMPDENPEELEGKGGAFELKDGSDKDEVKNNLLIGNSVENNQTPSKLFLNVFSLPQTIRDITNLGFDNGTESKDTVAQAYGKYPVILAGNGSKVKAGRKEDATVVPTIMIAPEMGATGFANMKGTKSLNLDQRRFERKGKSDIGAVEISSLLYDANGGNFTLAELSKYDGKTYYEGKNPAQYAKVGNPGSEYTIIDGKTVLKPVKAGKVFLGWSDVKNDKVAKLKFGAGKKVSVDDQKVLYAVWKDETYALKYFNNGKTTGTIPTQKNVKPNTEVIIKTKGKLKRKGYKFVGWSTKPSSKKGETIYAPGKKMKIVKNIKLYAIWKR